jgi:hypothetical protein
MFYRTIQAELQKWAKNPSKKSKNQPNKCPLLLKKAFGDPWS